MVRPPLDIVAEAISRLQSQHWRTAVGDCSITFWFGRTAWKLIKSDVAARAFGGTNSERMALRGASLRLDSSDEAPVFKGVCTLNGFPVWEIDFETDSERELLADYPASSLKVLAHAFDGGRVNSMTVTSPILQFVERVPLEAMIPAAPDKPKAQSFDFVEIDFETFADAGLVKVKRHARGWDVSLTFLGRQAIASWIAHN